jgi:hypothetical protein
MALLTVEGIVSFIILIAMLIWFCLLFLKEKNDSESFRAIKLFATFSLLALFCWFAISFNLLRLTDVQGNIVAGRTIIYRIPQIILALPYLVLFKFISTYGRDMTSETAST